MTAREYFFKGRNLKFEIDELIEARRRAYNLACKTTMSYDAAGKPYLGNTENRYNGYATLTEKLEKCTRRLQEYQSCMLTAISLIDNSTYRTLLTAYYINARTWEQSAEAAGISVRHAYRLHNAAIMAVEARWRGNKKRKKKNKQKN